MPAMGGREPGGDGEGDADRAAWQATVADATPIEGRDKVEPPAAPKTLRRRKGGAPAEGAVFAIQRIGEQVEGKASGADDALLRKLRNGEFPADVRVDLHGLQAPAARRAVHEAISRLFAQGKRCALVVHGRGRHSESEPVLKDALLEWLAEPPVGERVLAFTSARGRDGGVGATYVLLRRSR
jgi:DNA-nicking Smr family endonuclease